MNRTILVIKNIGSLRHLNYLLESNLKFDIGLDFKKFRESEIELINKFDRKVINISSAYKNVIKSYQGYNFKKIISIANYFKYKSSLYSGKKYLISRGIDKSFLIDFLFLKLFFHRYQDLLNFLRQIANSSNFQYDSKTEIFKNYKSVIFTTLNEFDSREQILAFHLKQYNLKILYYVLSWDNLTNKSTLIIEPNILIIWNSYQKLEAQKFHFLNSKTIETGAISFKEIINFKENREEIYILYLFSSKSISTISEEFKLINLLTDFINQEKINIKLKCKPHPQKPFDHSHLKNILDQKKINYEIIQDNQLNINDNLNTKLYQLIGNSMFCLGYNSSTMLEALLLKKIVVSLDNIHGCSETIHYDIFKEFKNFYYSTDNKKLMNIFRKITEKKIEFIEDQKISKYLNLSDISLNISKLKKEIEIE